MQPLKTNFNQQPTKLLKQEWIFQKEIELVILQHVRNFGNSPAKIDLLSLCSFIDGQDNTEQYTSSKETAKNKTKVQKKEIKKWARNSKVGLTETSRIYYISTDGFTIIR
jgi:hypothetical protein